MKLDVSLLDQEKIRHQRRRKLWAILAVPVVVLVVLAGMLVRTGVFNVVVGRGTDFVAMEMLAEVQLVGNVVEPYVAWYDMGYAKLGGAESGEALAEAEVDLRESLKHNPPEEMLCAIYGNLSYAVELQADLKVEEKQYDEVLVMYNRAEALLYENGCASKVDGEEGKSEKSEAAKERVVAKRRKAIDAINNVKDEGGEDEGENDGKQEMTEDDLQKINEAQSEMNENGASILRHSVGSDNSSVFDWDKPNF